LGPAPTLPVKPPWVHLRPPPAPTGVSHHLRWMPDGVRALRMARRAFWAFYLKLPCSTRREASGTVVGYNSRGGDWLRLRWLIQGKRAEDGGHNLVNTVTANQ
jgi:hypothetical protein